MKRTNILLIPSLLHSLHAFYIDGDNRTVTAQGADIRTSDVLECGDSTELAEGGQVGISSPVSRYLHYSTIYTIYTIYTLSTLSRW